MARLQENVPAGWFLETSLWSVPSGFPPSLEPAQGQRVGSGPCLLGGSALSLAEGVGWPTRSPFVGLTSFVCVFFVSLFLYRGHFRVWESDRPQRGQWL